MRFSPIDAMGYLFTDGLALVHSGAGRYEAAIDGLRKAGLPEE
jgi:hypothetical protein